MYKINRLDFEVENAVNFAAYKQAYLPLVTISNDNEVKRILGCGNSDRIEMYEDELNLYVISYNTGIPYISMTAVSTSLEGKESGIYLQGDEADPILQLLDEQGVKAVVSELSYYLAN